MSQLYYEKNYQNVCHLSHMQHKIIIIINDNQIKITLNYSNFSVAD